MNYESLFKERNLLINERNKILDSFFKSYFFRKRLKQIDRQLDSIEKTLYQTRRFELKKIPSDSELKDMVVKAKIAVNEIIKDVYKGVKNDR